MECQPIQVKSDNSSERHCNGALTVSSLLESYALGSSMLRLSDSHLWLDSL